MFIATTISCIAGDEVLAVNGCSLAECSHAQAIASFKSIKLGHVTLTIGRRNKKRTQQSPLPSQQHPTDTTNNNVTPGNTDNFCQPSIDSRILSSYHQPVYPTSGPTNSVNPEGLTSFAPNSYTTNNSNRLFTNVHPGSRNLDIEQKTARLKV